MDGWFDGRLCVCVCFFFSKLSKWRSGSNIKIVGNKILPNRVQKNTVYITKKKKITIYNFKKK